MPARRNSEDLVAPLIAYLRERHTLSDENAGLVRARVRPVQLARGDLVQRAGDVARNMTFVTKGILRSYVIDEDGREHVLRFAPEGWWLGDPDSARTGNPSLVFMEAIEPSRVLRLSYEDHEWMMQAIPGHAAAFARGVQRMVAARERWIVGTLSDSAEERYREFLETYPGIAVRVPLRMIASYLGITPETLSRVRRKLAGNPARKG